MYIKGRITSNEITYDNISHLFGIQIIDLF